MLLIKNIKIVDGSGEPARQGDVLVSGDIISAIGHFPHKKAETVIDGLGMYLTPGFIEPHTHADHLLTLFTDPEQKEYRAQGITTIVGGNDGISLAPIIYGSLRSLEKWTDTNAINVNWHSVSEFIQAITHRSLGVNFGTLVGYETVRRDITQETNTDLTHREYAVLFHTIEQALHEGALGISVNLTKAYNEGIAHHELMAAAKTAARLNRLLALHPGAEDDHYMEMVSRALLLYKKTGVTILLKKFVPRVINAARAQEYLRAYDALHNAGDNLFIEIACAETTVMPLYELLPHWAQGKSCAAMYATLQNPSHRKQIAKELPRLKSARVIRAPREYQRLIGKTLEEYALSRGSSFKEGVLALMDCTKLHAVLLVPQDTDTILAAHLMEYPHILFSGQPRAFFKAADRKRWPVEKTVSRITAVPAHAYNLKHRGLIRENYYADLVVMNDRYEIIHTIVGGSAASNAGRFIPC